MCDNGRSNKNKKVEEYLKTSKIKIHYLPPYSPNLNPIERLWKVLRQKKLTISVMKNLRILKNKYGDSFLKKY
ncbi:transposase [Parachlamydia acanthamoebae]|uniref:transposase n=1 Tax=Parachlamydia acanthamoebae TaxID=83552 RepID=UPI0038CD3F99